MLRRALPAALLLVAALAAPGLQRAVAASPGRGVLVHNLFTVESVTERGRVLAGHGVPVRR